MTDFDEDEMKDEDGFGGDEMTDIDDLIEEEDAGDEEEDPLLKLHDDDEMKGEEGIEDPFSYGFEQE